MSKNNKKIKDKDMNLLDRILNGRQVFAFLAILTSFGIVGFVAATYYQSSAKASYEGFTTFEVKPDDYTAFKQQLDAPKIDYTNTDKVGTNTTNSQSTTTPPVITTQPVSPAIQGDYKGNNSKIFTSDLEFPSSRLFIANNLTFDFTGENLDLSKLNIEQLKVNGHYPVLILTASGKLIPDKDLKTAQLNIDSIQSDFEINGQSVDNSTKSQLLRILDAAGKTIPKPSKAVPLYLKINTNLTSNTLTIENTGESSFILYFKGKK